MSDLGREIDRVATELAATIVSEAQAIATEHHRDAFDVAKQIALTTRRILPKPDLLASYRHAKTADYLTRVQIIAPHNEGVLADSDPELLDLDQVGTEVVAGLYGVAGLACVLVTAYHASLGEAVDWPGRAEIERRMKTIRVILSRGGGRGRWRIPYRVNGLEYTAFVLVVRK